MRFLSLAVDGAHEVPSELDLFSAALVAQAFTSRAALRDVALARAPTAVGGLMAKREFACAEREFEFGWSDTTNLEAVRQTSLM